VAKPLNIEMPNHQAGFLQQRAVWAPSQCQMLLRCTTASYHAGDFRKEKTKMEDEFDWQANKED